MTRAKAIWLAVAVTLVTVAGLVLLRRRRTPMVAAPTISPAPPLPVRASTSPDPDNRTTEEEGTARPLPADRDWPMHTEFGDLATDDTDRPLATWVRVAIVVVALLAFFVVSLLAKKNV